LRFTGELVAREDLAAAGAAFPQAEAQRAAPSGRGQNALLSSSTSAGFFLRILRNMEQDLVNLIRSIIVRHARDLKRPGFCEAVPSQVRFRQRP